MKKKGYHSSRSNGTAVGIDIGATLAKIALRTPGKPTEFILIPAAAHEDVAEAVERSRPGRIGVTGGGAGAVARTLESEVVHVNEFAAWGAGSAAFLREQRDLDLGGQRHLVVSVGTGTSVMLVDGLSVSRIGGTALGGGTVVGLGSLLTSISSFSRLAQLAREGRRQNVDLLVSDIYRSGEIPLAGDLTASNFGKLLRSGSPGTKPEPEDLAHALMGLVGENIALVCAGLAANAQVSQIVFGGSTLRANPALVDVLGGVTQALGRQPIFLEQGEHVGALGALLLASDR